MTEKTKAKALWLTPQLPRRAVVELEDGEMRLMPLLPLEPQNPEKLDRFLGQHPAHHEGAIKMGPVLAALYGYRVPELEGLEDMVALVESLRDKDLCCDFTLWLARRSYKSLAEAWENCPNGSWMLWYLGTLPSIPNGLKDRMVLAAIDIIELARPAWENRDIADMVHEVIDTARAWVQKPRDERLAVSFGADWYPSIVDPLVAVMHEDQDAYADLYYVVNAAANAMAGRADYKDSEGRGIHRRSADIVRKYFPANMLDKLTDPCQGD